MFYTGLLEWEIPHPPKKNLKFPPTSQHLHKICTELCLFHYNQVDPPSPESLNFPQSPEVWIKHLKH